MALLQKASLVQLTPSLGNPVPVQFNPTTLRLQMTNNIEGGKSRPRQVQQFTGSSSTTLSMDLVFDTADQQTSVRDRTLEIAKFLMPSTKSKQAPPRVRFEWGQFRFEGVMNSITEDVDLFSPDGTPLRSKLSISIKEQDSNFEALKSGAGAKTGSAAQPPGDTASVTGPGSTGGGPTDSTAVAHAGESAADFAARMGLDPTAWRGIAAGISNPLSLEGGAQIDFNSNLSVSAGIGVSAQFQAGASLDLNVAAGLQLQAGASGTAVAAAQAGFALSAAGGVSAATQAVDVVRTETAAAQARAAFEVPPPATGAASGSTPARTVGAGSVPAATASVVAARSAIGIDPAGAAPPPDRTPLFRTSGQVTFPDAAGPAPLPPRSDPRAVSFGFGIPLRPRITGAAEDRPGADGWVRVGARPRTANPPQVVDPTAFPWLALPAISLDRTAADSAQGSRSLSAMCACGACGSGSRACACGGLR